MDYVDVKIADLKAGKRVCLSGETLDAIIERDSDFANLIASARNAAGVGTKDTHIAWAKAKAKPFFAVGLDGQAWARIDGKPCQALS